MADEWQNVPLGELAEIFDGPHATPPKTEAGPVFLGISSLREGRVNLSETEHLSEEDFIRWTRRVQPSHDDVVFSYETRLGEAARIPRGLRCCLGRRMGLLRPKYGRVDSRFLLYAYLGPQFQEVIRERTIHGSTVDRIPLVDMAEFPIRIPVDASEQRAIAHILGTLDDKIELNRRMSETLESIARALFQSWFVDFDPVRAKSEGRDTGLPKHIADLFPDGFEESELGEIPRGWQVGALNQVTRLVTETVHPGDDPTKLWEHYSIPAYDEGRRPKGDLGTEIKSNKYRVPASSILVSKLNPQFPRVWLPDVVDQTAAICSTEFMPFIPLKADWRPWLYALTTSSAFQAEIADRVTGSTGSRQRVTPTEIAKLPILQSPAEIIDRFSAMIGPILVRSTTLLSESTTVACARDALLPQLISGELRIEDAERFSSEVAG